MRILALAMLAALPLVASAQGGKILENKHGRVAFQRVAAHAVALAERASVDLHDRDTAITGANSLGAVTLPDSTQILIGSSTHVQLAFFNQAETTSAKFILKDGRIRFAVHHPQGAKANYLFATPTSQIAVRGTQGDLEVDGSGTIHLNVYELGNPNLPVVVTTAGGKVYDVAAGQGLVARIVNGQIQVEVGRLTQALVDRFTGDFGLPTNWTQLKNTIMQKAAQQLPAPPSLPVPIPLPPR
uniref:FecR protein domain-containing protein n=1 Tax=mine drainage metagenome TaxID=410659 RepID=E6PEV0_9ZZZZ